MSTKRGAITELVIAMRAGHHERVSELVEILRRILIARHVKNGLPPFDVDDVAQTVILELLEKSPDEWGQIERDSGSYTIGILWKKVMDAHRRRRRDRTGRSAPRASGEGARAKRTVSDEAREALEEPAPTAIPRATSPADREPRSTRDESELLMGDTLRSFDRYVRDRASPAARRVAMRQRRILERLIAGQTKAEICHAEALHVRMVERDRATIRSVLREMA